MSQEAEIAVLKNELIHLKQAFIEERASEGERINKLEARIGHMESSIKNYGWFALGLVSIPAVIMMGFQKVRDYAGDVIVGIIR